MLKGGKRKNPGKTGVFASIRNAKGSLNELRNRRFQVRPLTGANSTAAVILYWIPAAVFLLLSFLRPDALTPSGVLTGTFTQQIQVTCKRTERGLLIPG
jgi:Flp pilus assembly protein TadB